MMKIAQQQNDVHSKYFAQMRSDSLVGQTSQPKVGHPRLQ